MIRLFTRPISHIRSTPLLRTFSTDGTSSSSASSSSTPSSTSTSSSDPPVYTAWRPTRTQEVDEEDIDVTSLSQSSTDHASTVIASSEEEAKRSEPTFQLDNLPASENIIPEKIRSRFRSYSSQPPFRRRAGTRLVVHSFGEKFCVLDLLPGCDQVAPPAQTANAPLNTAPSLFTTNTTKVTATVHDREKNRTSFPVAQNTKSSTPSTPSFAASSARIPPRPKRGGKLSEVEEDVVELPSWAFSQDPNKKSAVSHDNQMTQTAKSFANPWIPSLATTEATNNTTTSKTTTAASQEPVPLEDMDPAEREKLVLSRLSFEIKPVVMPFEEKSINAIKAPTIRLKCRNSVMLYQNFMFLWKPSSWDEITVDSVRIVTLLVPKPEFVLFGSGYETCHLKKEVLEFFRAHNIGVEVMDSSNASAMYGLLADEGRLMVGFMLNSDSDVISKYSNAIRERPSTLAKKRLGLPLSPRELNPLLWNPRDGWITASEMRQNQAEVETRRQPKSAEKQQQQPEQQHSQTTPINAEQPKQASSARTKRPPLPFMRPK